MRDCQICGSSNRIALTDGYDGIREMCLCECDDCGHRYIDGAGLSQAYFDKYYIENYRTDDLIHSEARLDSLADLVANYEPNCVLDIGGMDCELLKRLYERNLKGEASGVGDSQMAYDPTYEAVILSHTLEHIYDIGAMFQRIDAALTRSGYLFIEIPIHLKYNHPSMYDYHWQHVNKFRSQDIERLCTRKGFEIVTSEQIADYREYNVWRIVGRM